MVGAGFTCAVNDASFLTDLNTRGALRPRVGCFEIKANGSTVVSLTGLKRPFGSLKALDMDEVVADTLGGLK